MNIPGTDLNVLVWRDGLHARSREQGTWDMEPSTPEVLISVVEHLSRASLCYREDRILPQSFYRGKGVEALAADGVVVYLAYSVLRLADLSGWLGVRHLEIWDGGHRHHTAFYHDLHSIMGRVLRWKEDYPHEAVSMIEKLAATWVGREEFWRVVLELSKGRKEQ